MTNYETSLIETREVNSEEVPHDTIHLFWCNKETNNFNALKRSRIPTESIFSKSKDSVGRMGTGEN